jgi:hypothetical protein
VGKIFSIFSSFEKIEIVDEELLDNEVVVVGADVAVDEDLEVFEHEVLVPLEGPTEESSAWERVTSTDEPTDAADDISGIDSVPLPRGIE